MMNHPLLRIATRNSPLAIAQAEQVGAALQQAHPALNIKIISMTTSGDKQLDTLLATKGGKGLFVKELEQAVLQKTADFAVHSIKDMPVYSTAGLMLAAICERADARDAFISNRYQSLQEMPSGAKIGTASLRRQCQLKAHYPHLVVAMLRGNINSRLRRLDAGEFDGIILAAAGLQRLELNQRINSYLDPAIFIPAVGQGALGLECRAEDLYTQDLLAALDHAPSRYCILAERAMNRYLEGGCQVPIAGYAELKGNQLTLRGMVGKPDGSLSLFSQQAGAMQEAEHIGKLVAAELLAQGADSILQEVYQQYG